jgi:hypothetical protein
MWVARGLHLAVRAVAPAVLCLAAGAIAASPAQAARLHIPDGTGDVWSPDGPDWSREGSVVNADVDRSHVRYRAGSVVIRVHYADLKKHTSDEVAVDAYLLTDAPHRFHVLFAGYTHFNWINLTKGAAEKQVECPALMGHMDYRANRLRISIPRGCIGSPRWIRYKAKAWAYSERDGLYVDDTASAGPEPKTWSSTIRHN